MKMNKMKTVLIASLTMLTMTFAGGLVSLNATATGSEQQTATFTSADLIMPGASIRLKDEPNGIRFPVRLTPETYNTFKGKISESGTLIVPQEFYKAGELVLENVGKDDYQTEKIVTTNNWQSVQEKVNEGTAEETTVSYMQTLIYVHNIPEEYLNKDFYVKGYVVIDGEAIYSAEVNRSMTDVAQEALADYPTYAETLQSYIKYDVTFDPANGEEKTVATVGYGEKAVEWTPTPAQSYAFSHWALDGEEYDFNTVVEENITLTAVYEQISRYEVILGDGTENGGWGHDPATGYACESSIAFTQFEGDNVMALTMKDTDRTKTSPAYLTIDRAGNYAEKMQLASRKRYIGFRVYSPIQGAQIDILIHNGSKVTKKWYCVQKGWNEFSFDIQKFVAGTQVVIDEETPIYRLGLGVYGNEKLFGAGTEATNAEYTFYFDEVYATNYDMTNIVDFESVGDLNRYADGTSVYAYYRYQTASGATAQSGVSKDGEKVLQVKATADRMYGSIMFNGAPNSSYTHVWFPTDLSGCSKIKIRAKVDDASQYLRIYLKNYNTALGETVNKIANTVAYAEFIKGTTEWVEYELDLTTIDDSLLKTVGQMTFDTAGSAVGCSFYIDYVQFIY